MPPAHTGRNVRQRLFLKNLAPDRISDAEMKKQRDEKRERHVVEQSDGQIEILAEADRLIDMKDERRKTNGRKMQDERRLAALFEKDEDADTEPDQPDDRKKDDRRRPTRDAVDVL